MKIVYLYNEDGLFINEYNCQESPLEPGVFLLPNRSTELIPPSHKDGYHVRFDGEKWGYIINRHAIYEHQMEMLSIKNEVGVFINYLADDGEVKKYTDEEMKSLVSIAKREVIRKRREPLLAGVDYLVNEMVLGDLPLTAKDSLKAYRKKLLDLTDGVDEKTDLNKIELPKFKRE